MKKSKKKSKRITSLEQLEEHIKTLDNGCKTLRRPEDFKDSYQDPQFALSRISPFCEMCGHEYCSCEGRLWLNVKTNCGFKDCLNTEHFVIYEEEETEEEID